MTPHDEPTTRPPTQTVRDGVLELRESDSGSSIKVAVGDTIHVVLPGGAAGGYHQPESSDSSLERTKASGGYPDGADAVAVFVARSSGAADLTSITDYVCLHADPRCLPPQRQWVVHVVVR